MRHVLSWTVRNFFENLSPCIIFSWFPVFLKRDIYIFDRWSFIWKWDFVFIWANFNACIAKRSVKFLAIHLSITQSSPVESDWILVAQNLSTLASALWVNVYQNIWVKVEWNLFLSYLNPRAWHQVAYIKKKLFCDMFWA